MGRTPEDDEAIGLLAAELGFDGTRDDTLYAPYMAYVQAHWPGRASGEDFLRLFTDLVAYFRRTYAALNFDNVSVWSRRSPAS